MVERLEWEAEFNSAFLVEAGEVRARYDKVHLTPFGEVMPLISRWTWLEEKLLALGERDDLRALTREPGLAERATQA